MKNNQRKIGAVLSYVSIAANTLVQLLYTPFLVGKLGQSEFGLYSLVSSIIGYLTVLDLGFGNAIIVHTAKYRALGETKKEQTLHGMFHLIYIVIGVLAGIVGVVLSLNCGVFFGGSMSSGEINKMRIMLLILSFNLFLSFSFSIYNSIITANERFIFQKIISIASTIAKPLLMMPILFLGYKSIALCLVITLVNIVVLIMSYYYCKRKIKASTRFSGFDKSLFKTILTYSFWIFLTQVVDKINWSADQFILGAVSGTIAVSVYSAAATLNSMFINLATAISGVMLPKISKMVAKKASNEELSNEFIKVGRIQFIVVFLAASGLVIVGKEFINLWLGKGFEQTYVIALLLIIPAVLSLCQNTGLAIMQAMNRFSFKAISTFIMSIANIIASVFLAMKYGAPGAAFGTGASIIIVNIIVMDIYYTKKIGLNIARFWKNLAIMALKYMLPIGITVGLIAITDFSGLSAFLIYGSIYVIIYLLTTYLLVVNPYEKKLIKSAINKILRRS